MYDISSALSGKYKQMVWHLIKHISTNGIPGFYKAVSADTHHHNMIANESYLQWLASAPSTAVVFVLAHL